MHFNPRLETILETDASGGVAAGVLSQKSEADGFFHPVAFYSKTLSATEMRYDIHDKEMLAIVLALKRWKADLVSLRTPFLIITDHKALEYFSEKRVLNDRQIGWTELLTGFVYKITYRPGKQNILADTLTRKLEDLRTQKAIRDASRTGLLLPEDSIAVPIDTDSTTCTSAIASTADTVASVAAVVTRQRTRAPPTQADQRDGSPLPIQNTTKTANPPPLPVDKPAALSTPPAVKAIQNSAHATPVPIQDALPPVIEATPYPSTKSSFSPTGAADGETRGLPADRHGPKC